MKNFAAARTLASRGPRRSSGKLILMLVAALAAASCSGGGSEAEEATTPLSNEVTGSSETSTAGSSGCESVTARASHPTSDQSSKHKALQTLSEEVSERTDGRVTIDIFPLSQLGGIPEMVSGLQSGSVDIALIDLGTLAQHIPELGAFELPYMFTDEYEQFNTMMDGDVGQMVADKIATTLDIVPLYWVSEGRHDLFTTSQEVHEPSDLEGLAIRVLDTPGQTSMIQAMGGSPTPIDTSEIYNALETGVVDGFSFPRAAVVDLALFEPIEHMSRTGHTLTNIGFHAGAPLLNSLCPTDREALLEAAEVAKDVNRQLAISGTSEATDRLGEELNVVEEPDVDAFQEATAHLHDAFVEEHGAELYDAIAAQIDS